MPQLDPSTFTSQLFWLCVCFFTMLFFMSRFIVPKIAETLEQRRHRIDGYLEKAAALKEQAEEMLAKYQEALREASQKADESLNAATKEMNELVALRQKELEAELSRKVSHAEKQISKARDEARQEVSKMAEALSITVLNRLDIKNIKKADISNALKTHAGQD